MDINLTKGEDNVAASPQIIGARQDARILALFIDLLVLMVINFFAYLPVSSLLKSQGVYFGVGPFPNYSLYLFDWLYYTLSEGLFGASIGKFILKLRVIQIDGNPCTLWSAFVRAIFRSIELLLFGLPALFSMHPPLQQRIGDRVARTVVVEASSPVISQHRATRVFLASQCGYFFLAVVGMYLRILILHY